VKNKLFTFLSRILVLFTMYSNLPVWSPWSIN